MDQKQYRINIVIIILLFFLFISSIFVIAGTKYNLWVKWFAEEQQSYSLSLVTQETKWKYMDIGEEPGVGNVWTTEKYDANTWKVRQGIFEKQLSKDKLSSTAFFRYEFNIEDISKYKHIEGNIKYKDAVIVYLNGSIIYTGNIPSGGYYSNQDMGASNTLDSIAEGTFYVTDLNHLKEGKNILAVEVHRKDKDSTNMYFYLPYLRISETNKQENIPNTKGMMLIQGKEGDELEVNWFTDYYGSFKVEYMEGTKEKIRKSTFSKYANSVIMGSKKSEYEGMYINTATLTRLKAGSNYVYRVIPIGGKEGSIFYEFNTAEKKETTFLYPGVIQYSYLNNMSVDLFQGLLQRGIYLCGGADYLILGKDKNVYDDYNIKNRIEKGEIKFRVPMELKEIPVIFTEYDKEAKLDNKEEASNYYWTYSDMIFIRLDTKNKDYKENKEFMGQVIKGKNRKWVIIMMNTSTFGEDGEVIKEYKKLFQEFDVDIVLDKGNMYSRYYDIGEGIETEETIYKTKGETVYITGGIFIGHRDEGIRINNKRHSKFEEEKPCIIKVNASRLNITIEIYRIEDGKKIDFFHIVKK